MNKHTQTLRGKTTDELNEELLLLRKEMFNLRMQLAAQQSTKTSELKRVSRAVARVLTILGERRRGVAAEPAAKPATKSTPAAKPAKSDQSASVSAARTPVASKAEKQATPAVQAQSGGDQPSPSTS